MSVPASLEPGKINGGAWQPTKLMHWYDSIIDVMLTNPGVKHKEIAALLGRSPVTIGMVVNSDLFKARYAQRRQQFDHALHERMAAKLAGVAEKSLDLTLEVLNKKQTGVPLEQLLDINSQTLGMLGYGPKPSNGGLNVSLNLQQNNGSVAVSKADLAQARASLREREQGLLIEGSAREIGAPTRDGEGEG